MEGLDLLPTEASLLRPFISVEIRLQVHTNRFILSQWITDVRHCCRKNSSKKLCLPVDSELFVTSGLTTTVGFCKLSAMLLTAHLQTPMGSQFQTACHAIAIAPPAQSCHRSSRLLNCIITLNETSCCSMAESYLLAKLHNCAAL